MAKWTPCCEALLSAAAELPAHGTCRPSLLSVYCASAYDDYMQASSASGIGIRCSFILIALPCMAQDLNLSPTRPTIANSATIQSAGVLQVETGYDAYPRSVPGDQQTVATNFYYTPLSRLRLDFGWSPVALQQQSPGQNITGVGTIQIGGKIELKNEKYHRLLPGLAVQYEAELPTASHGVLSNFGQQAILLLNHHYGRNGDLDVIVNASLVQSDCQKLSGCDYGGQQSLAVSYHVQKQTRIYAEVFGQNNSESNTPPGTYLFAGFFHQFGDAFGIDGGLRFGVSSRSAGIGSTVGLVFGKRLRDMKSSRR